MRNSVSRTSLFFNRNSARLDAPTGIDFRVVRLPLARREIHLLCCANEQPSD
jgi:hypothetical protein